MCCLIICQTVTIKLINRSFEIHHHNVAKPGGVNAFKVCSFQKHEDLQIWIFYCWLELHSWFSGLQHCNILNFHLHPQALEFNVRLHLPNSINLPIEMLGNILTNCNTISLTFGYMVMNCWIFIYSIQFNLLGIPSYGIHIFLPIFFSKRNEKRKFIW